jgi:hypothetical protein
MFVGKQELALAKAKNIRQTGTWFVFCAKNLQETTNSSLKSTNSLSSLVFFSF